MTVGELLAYLRLDDNPFKRTLAAARERFRAWGASTAEDADRYGRDAGKIYGHGFFFASDGTLRNRKGQFVGAEEAARLAGERAGRSFGRKLLDLAGDGIRSLFSTMSNAASGAAGAASSLAGSLGGLGSVLMWVVGIVALAAPAMYILGGALGALPALVGGAAVAFGVFALAMHGIGEHFKKTASGGGAVADTAHRIAQAQKAVIRADKDLRAATEGVNRARRDEIKHLRDLNLQLARAALNEESAAAAVAKAREELARARGLGDPNEIAEADRNLRDANLTLEETKNAHADLAEEKAESDRVGVEGSERVQQALDRQAQAVDALAEAQYNLAQAQKGTAGGGAGQDLPKIARSAQDFIDKVKSLGAAWEQLRLDVQQRLFDGIGDAVVRLAKAWQGPASVQLGKMADVFNSIIKTFTASAADPKFITDVSTGLDSVRRLVDRIGHAVAGPFMGAWARLSAAAAPFVDMLGDKLGGIIEEFSAWIEESAKNGKLQEFFQNASVFAANLFDVVTAVVKIVGDLFTILTGGRNASTDSKNPAVALKNALDSIHEWLSDPENQKKLQEFVKGLQDFLLWLFNDGVPQIRAFFDAMSEWKQKFDEWSDDVKQFKDDVKSHWDDMIGFFGGLPKRITSASRDMFSSIPAAFKDALNGVIRSWNRLSFRTPSVELFGARFEGRTIDFPDVPELEAGAMVGRRSGGTLARLGEGREDEMVAPVSKAQAMIRQAVADVLAGLDLGGGDVIVSVDGEVIERRALRAVRRNPDAVAAAAKAGNRSRTFAGGTSASFA